MSTDPATLGLLGLIIAAIITQIGYIAVATLNRRKSRSEKEATAVDILQDVTAELRLEMVRVTQDRTETVQRLKIELSSQEANNNVLRDELRQARQDARGAHETTGRAMRRVEYLERILRDHDIIFDSGPLA